MTTFRIFLKMHLMTHDIYLQTMIKYNTKNIYYYKHFEILDNTKMLQTNGTGIQLMKTLSNYNETNVTL